MAPGRIPYKPGTVLGVVPAKQIDKGSPTLTPEEQTVLEAGGWNPGEPIPNLQGTKLGNRLTAERERLRTAAENVEGMTPIPPDTPPIAIPIPVPIESLPPERQTEIRQGMDEMAEIQQQILGNRAVAQHETAVTAPDSIAGVPGMPEAFRTAAEAQGVAPAGVVIENDLGPGGEMPASVQSEQPAARPPAHPDATPATAETYCPKCGHDLSADIFAPTDMDIRVYMQAVLGGQRFRKDYSVLADQMQITFRGLTPAEGQLARVTAMADASDGTVYDYTMRLLQYRMTMSIERIQKAGQSPIAMTPLLDTCTLEKGPQKLRELQNWLDHRVHVTEEGRQTVADAWTEFNGVMNVLQSRARDPDFFAGAVTPDS